MQSLYEILKTSKLGAGSAPDMYTALMSQKMRGGGSSEIEYTGAVPVTIKADGNPLLAWTISGNMSQSGTPTPGNPIQPSECGERTGNLCYLYKTGYRLDNTGNEIEAENFNIYATPASANTTYTLNLNYSSAGTTTLRIIAYNNGSFSYKIAEVNLNSVPYTFTTPSACDEVKISLSNQSTYIMLNLGSTALPYEPYGYKIPISSANTTTPVYLGEVETERKIKKLVLDGTEGFIVYSDDTKTYRLIDAISTAPIAGFGISTHYARGTGSSTLEDESFYMTAQRRLYIRDTNCETLTAFTTFLQQQYAAGTPVTVWYILATPTTGIVNEPLRKIGDYADTISNVAEIPTTAGSQTFDVQTTLKPSEVYIKYRG